MFQYRISIVIPVYNSEKTLARTLQSIISQVQYNVEIILVDDGSMDRGYSICDEYALKYSFVNAIHKKNGGLSSARNVGIDNAKGEYVTFIDSDDYYSDGLFEQVLKLTESNKLDCIYYGWNYVIGEEKQPGRIADLQKNVLLDYNYIHKFIIPPLINLRKDSSKFIDDFSVNKFYRADILNTYKIRFNENRRIWEDRPFVVEYLKYCNSLWCLDGYWYNYVQTMGSLSGKYYLNFFDIILENYDLYYRLFKEEYNFETQYVCNYWCHSIENMIFRSLAEIDNKEKIKNNIIGTLQKPIVQKWYKNHSINNSYEKEILNLINDQKYEQVIGLYKKILYRNQRKEKIESFKLIKFIKYIVILIFGKRE